MNFEAWFVNQFHRDVQSFIMEHDDDVAAKWDSSIIIVSFILAYMGAYSTVCLAGLYRTAGTLKTKVLPQHMYLVIMSISLGGGAIWSMHFVGMSAVTFTDEEGHKIDVRYDLVKSLLSLLTCIVFVYFGLMISCRDKMFCREKEEIIQLIIEEGKRDDVEKMGAKRYFARVVLFRGTHNIILGGTVAGGGVCVMHYLGMLAITSDMQVHWNGGIVFASVLIAITAASAAFWILFRVLALYPGFESLRALSSFVAAVAVCGMHYTGMMAASYTHEEDMDHTLLGPTIDTVMANILALVTGVVISWGVSMLVQAELRAWHDYLHERLKESRGLLGSLRLRYESDTSLRNYEKKNEKHVTTYEIKKSRSNRASFNDSTVFPEEYEVVLEEEEEENVEVTPATEVTPYIDEDSV